MHSAIWIQKIYIGFVVWQKKCEMYMLIPHNTYILLYFLHINELINSDIIIITFYYIMN